MAKNDTGRKATKALFGGIGEPTGTWTRRTYRLDGSGASSAAAPAKRGPSIRHRFKPFISQQVTEDAAKRHGLARPRSGGTAFQTERELNRYLAAERDHGRAVGWKEH